MWDIFSPSHEDLRNVAKSLQAQNWGVILALIHKGILTPEDIGKFRVQAVAEIDQLWEQSTREMNAEALAENPGLATMAKLFGTEIPLPIQESQSGTAPIMLRCEYCGGGFCGEQRENGSVPRFCSEGCAARARRVGG